MKKNFHVFCFVGRSGCGKGTQVKLLKRKYSGLFEIETGELFRDFSAGKSAVAQKTNKIVDSGALPPYWLSFHLWFSALLEFAKSAKMKKYRGIIFEGTPRREIEAKLMDEAVEFIFGVKPIMIYLDISEKEAYSRLLKRLVCKKCGAPLAVSLLDKKIKKCPECGGPIGRRDDDGLNGIKHRMEFFRKNVLGVVKHYRSQRSLVEVNGQQSVEAVFAELWQKLSKKI